VSVPPPSRPATGAAERIVAAARQMVRSEDLEEVLSVAAAALRDALGGEAVLRVTTIQHDLHANASGIVPPSALAPAARAALAFEELDGTHGADGADGAGAAGDGRGHGSGDGLLSGSRGEHAHCRVWIEGRHLSGDGAVERTVGELLLHSLAQSVDRIVMVDRFRQNEANLERAVESHRLVGQAMGILIERHRMTSEEAFGALRRASQDHNVKLREIARRVVETGSEPDEAV
jgi:hypothetical protein